MYRAHPQTTCPNDDAHTCICYIEGRESDCINRERGIKNNFQNMS